MNRFIFYNILIIIGLLTGCKKIELEPVDGDPVFEASAQFNDQSLSWQAGIAEYYMFSSHEKDQFDVYSFKGLIARETSDCCNTLEFIFRDSRQTIDGTPDISRAISTEIDYVFADNGGNDTILTTVTDTFWQANFIAQSFSQPQQSLSYEWDFGDQSGDTTFLETIDHIYQQIPDNQLVTLRATTQSNNCNSFFSRRVSTNNNPFQDCNLSLHIDTTTSTFTEINVTADFSGLAPYTYAWSDSSFFQTATFIPSPTGPSSFSVTVTDASGCTVSAGMSTNFVPGAIPPLCFAGFDYSVLKVLLDTQLINVEYADSLQFSAATIIYKDELGNEYRSDRQPQSQDAAIKILEVSDYDDNEKSEKTKKITVEFTCRIWNEVGEHIDVREGKAVIAVSYPD